MAGSTVVDVSPMDGDATQNACQRNSAHQEKEERALASIIRRTPDHKAHQVNGMSAVRKKLQERGILAEDTEIIMAPWKSGTEKQYQPHVNRWTVFCSRGKPDPLNPIVSDIINFLSETFHRGRGL